MNITPSELTREDPIFSERIESDIELKTHQLVCLNKCIQLENVPIDMNSTEYVCVKSNIGILGDKVGSGKSYVILALIMMNKTPLNTYNKQNVFGQYNSIYIEYNRPTLNRLNTNIIVCSFGLIDQWEYYIKTFNKQFNYKVINTHVKLSEFVKPNNPVYDILLVSSSFYKFVQTNLKERQLSVVRTIFDEADTTVTPNAKQIPSDFYWFVTASYKNLVNPYPNNQRHNWLNRELNATNFNNGIIKNVFIKTLMLSLLRTLPIMDHHILSDVIVKNDDVFVKESFALPEIISSCIECKDAISEIVKSMTNNSNIINSVNAGDLETAISFINKNNNNCDENHIIDVLKEEIEKNIQNCKAKKHYYNSIIVEDVEQHARRLQQLEEYEKDLALKIDYLTERIKNGDICSICYDQVNTKTVIKCCGNAYCLECICKWLKIKNTCPLCKANVKEFSDSLMVVNEKQSKTESTRIYNKLYTLELLLQKIKLENKNSKILIFSEYEKPFDKFADILTKLKIKHGVLKGTSFKSNLNMYRNLDIDVLLINSRAFGSGVNLENTTDVIIYHYFNLEIEKQVIGRAQRPGRTHSLKTWYLFNKDEMNKNKFRSMKNVML